MLSSIGRAAIRRVATRAPQLPTARPILSHGQLRTELSGPCLLFLARSYATADAKAKTTKKPKKATVTKAKASTKVASTKKATATKSKQKPVLAVANKKPKKKTTLKKAKAIPKKKILTEKQKDAKKLMELKVRMKTIEEKALLGQQPKGKLANPFFVFHAPKAVGRKDAVAASKESAREFKDLDPATREALNHEVNQNIAANELAYKQWVESHSPDTIRLANVARSYLRRHSKLKNKGAFRKIRDNRQPSHPMPAYIYFAKERHDSGDFRGITGQESFKLIGGEWRTLPAAERKAYEDLAAADRARYEQEFKTVFKHDSHALVDRSE